MDMLFRCDCGWEKRGDEEDVVYDAQQHARDDHGEDWERQDALDRMVPIQNEERNAV